MGFTVKHWMSVRRKVKGLNGDSNWSEGRRRLLHTVRILPRCYHSRFNVSPYERKRQFTNAVGPLLTILMSSRSHFVT